jgi:predicted aldo/keto reductase-like oxidoreductase
MKSLGGTGTRILKVGITAQEAISYALSLPLHTLVSGMDSLDVVTQNLEIVRNWRPLTDEEQDQLLERITPWAIDGRLEHYKTVW